MIILSLEKNYYKYLNESLDMKERGKRGRKIERERERERMSKKRRKKEERKEKERERGREKRGKKGKERERERIERIEEINKNKFGSSSLFSK